MTPNTPADVASLPAKLLPCPFCGNPDPVLDDLAGEYFVACGLCPAQHIIEAGRDHAIAAWNRRALTPAGEGGLFADLELVWNSVADDKHTNAAYQRLRAALAKPASGDGLPAGHPQAPMPDGWLTLAVPGGTESGRDFVHGPRRAIEVCQRALLATPEQPGLRKFVEGLACECGPDYSRGLCGRCAALSEQPGSSVQAAPAGVDCLELLPWSDFWQRQGRPDVSHNFAAFELAEAWATACISAATPPPAPAAEQGEECQHVWQADKDAEGWSYCPKCDCSRRLPATQPEARGVEGMAAIAERLVQDWQRDGRMPAYAWDFRGFAVDAMQRYAATPNPVRAEQPEGKGAEGWWCQDCQARVDPAAVTYDERHDERAGGCGMPVAAAPEPVRVDGEWLADVRRCLEDVSTEMRSRGRGDERFQRLIQRMPAHAPDGGAK